VSRGKYGRKLVFGLKMMTEPRFINLKIKRIKGRGRVPPSREEFLEPDNVIAELIGRALFIQKLEEGEGEDAR
jgi:hypothetical protein